MDNELFELCRSVYEKTGWKGGEHFITTIGGNWITDYKKGWYDETICKDEFYPLYTSDYLLEKLPESVDDFYTLYVGKDFAMYSDQSETTGHETKYTTTADTPLKALLKLVIALDDAGELK